VASQPLLADSQSLLNERAECSVERGATTRSFVVRPVEGGEPVRLEFYGHALLSEPLVAHVAERRPTFTGAVRRADGLAELPQAQQAP
jgi:hypothetical protein